MKLALDPNLKSAVRQLVMEEVVKAKAALPPFPLPNHDGETYERRKDKARLNAQTYRVWHLMSDQQWRTLREIARATGDPEASVSARLRDLRKEKFGGFDVQRQRRTEGTFEYRMMPPG